jgi:hypothetical protein
MTSQALELPKLSLDDADSVGTIRSLEAATEDTESPDTSTGDSGPSLPSEMDANPSLFVSPDTPPGDSGGQA